MIAKFIHSSPALAWVGSSKLDTEKAFRFTLYTILEVQKISKKVCTIPPEAMESFEFPDKMTIALKFHTVFPPNDIADITEL